TEQNLQLAEDDGKPGAGRQPGLHLTRAVRHRGRKSVADVDEPVHSVLEADGEKAPVQKRVVINDKVSLAPNIEELVGADVVPFPAELDTWCRHDVHISNGSVDVFPLALLIKTVT